jgi:hypothetical protein
MLYIETSSKRMFRHIHVHTVVSSNTRDYRLNVCSKLAARCSWAPMLQSPDCTALCRTSEFSHTNKISYEFSRQTWAKVMATVLTACICSIGGAFDQRCGITETLTDRTLNLHPARIQKHGTPLESGKS